jgi:23S rRNA pseudouridine2605 synthase
MKVKNFVMFRISKGSTTAKLAVGRMDKNTTGLLLFTNDTDMLRKFTTKPKSSKYTTSL